VTVPNGIERSLTGGTESVMDILGAGGAATVTASVAFAAPSPLVPPLPLAESPEPYRVTWPADAGAVRVNVYERLLPENAVAVLWAISPFRSLVLAPVACSVPPVVETSSPPTDAAPPDMVRVYTPLVPTVMLDGPDSETDGAVPPLWHDVHMAPPFVPGLPEYPLMPEACDHATSGVAIYINEYTNDKKTQIKNIGIDCLL
jgi:hypothetical protein